MLRRSCVFLFLLVASCGYFAEEAKAMYAPGMGRFISRDPIGYEDGHNMYRAVFVPGNLDPTGKCSLDLPEEDRVLHPFVECVDRRCSLLKPIGDAYDQYESRVRDCKDFDDTPSCYSEALRLLEFDLHNQVRRFWACARVCGIFNGILPPTPGMNPPPGGLAPQPPPGKRWWPPMKG